MVVRSLFALLALFPGLLTGSEVHAQVSTHACVPSTKLKAPNRIRDEVRAKLVASGYKVRKIKVRRIGGLPEETIASVDVSIPLSVSFNPLRIISASSGRISNEILESCQSLEKYRVVASAIDSAGKEEVVEFELSANVIGAYKPIPPSRGPSQLGK